MHTTLAHGYHTLSILVCETGGRRLGQAQGVAPGPLATAALHLLDFQRDLLHIQRL